MWSASFTIKILVLERDSNNNKKLRVDERYSSFLVDAKRYDGIDVLRWKLEKLPKDPDL